MVYISKFEQLCRWFSFIHLTNVENIEAEGLHEWGIRKYSGRCSSSTLNLHFSKI